MKSMINVTVNNAALAKTLGVAPGAKIDVECRHGVPVSKEWRNRFNDAKIDGCVTINQNSGKPAKAGKTEEDK